MRVLALADRPFHADVAKLAANYDVDAILTLGDLQPSWLESLDKCCQPKLGVYGNHDDEPYMTWFGIDDLHLNRIDLDSGVSFSGFEGCVSLPALRASAAVGPSYTQRQAKKLIRKLPAADVLLCHCPPRGVNDDPDDPAHIGFEALRDVGAREAARAVCCTATSTRSPGSLLKPHRRHPGHLRQRRQVSKVTWTSAIGRATPPLPAGCLDVDAPGRVATLEA